jgi:hypothetical protein
MNHRAKRLDAIATRSQVQRVDPTSVGCAIDQSQLGGHSTCKTNMQATRRLDQREAVFINWKRKPDCSNTPAERRTVLGTNPNYDG